MNKSIKMILILLFLILLFGYYIVLFEPNNIKIESQVITMKNLPQTFERVKIVQLSDFHCFKFGKRERRVLETVEKLEPDFIFITGDFIDSGTRDLKSCKSFWGILGEKYQDRIFGVLGNHDYQNPQTDILKNYLKESGIVILNNENKKLFVGSEFIYLIGVDDPFTGRDDLSRAIKETGKNLPKILLSHSPDIIEEAVKQKIDLVLAGHTHGGQIRIPFFGPLWVPSKYGRQYASGLFKIESSYLYVNQGIGTTILPIRFNCPPEITLIELQK